MITKLIKDHIIVHSSFCGEIREILRVDDYTSINLALAIDIRPTTAHYHESFDEIYFMLDGYIEVKFFEPNSSKILSQRLSANELCVISKSVHHGIIDASEKNRLCVITVPMFKASDEHASDKI